MARFVNYFKDHLALEEDNLEYDDEMNAILPSELWEAANEKKPTPEEFMRALETSGRLRLLCLNYGFQQDKKLHFTKQREELSGSNARAWAKAWGIDVNDEAAMKEFLKTNHFYHFITCYVTQNVPQYQIEDADWIVKCLESLFRYEKVFKNGKKILIDQEDREEWTGGPSTKVRKKGNVIKLQKVISKLWEDEPTVWKNIDEDLEKIRGLIHKYYPDFLDHIVFDTNDSSIILEVH